MRLTRFAPGRAERAHHTSRNWGRVAVVSGRRVRWVSARNEDQPLWHGAMLALAVRKIEVVETDVPRCTNYN